MSSDPSVPFNIDWYRDGQATPIMNSQRVGVQADGTLELQAVRASDVGVYSCMVNYYSTFSICKYNVLEPILKLLISVIGYISRWK